MIKMLGDVVCSGALPEAIGNCGMLVGYEFLMVITEDFSVVQSLTMTRKRSFQ